VHAHVIVCAYYRASKPFRISAWFRQPSSKRDLPSSLATEHISASAVVAEACDGLGGVPTKKFGGPKTCKISVNFGQLQNEIDLSLSCTVSYLTACDVDITWVPVHNSFPEQDSKSQGHMH